VRVSSAARAAGRVPGDGATPRASAVCGWSVNDCGSAPDSTSQRFHPAGSTSQRFHPAGSRQPRLQELSRSPGTRCADPRNRNGRENPPLGMRA
jgi:hypothetical protein